jgi:hypothetical protein
MEGLFWQEKSLDEDGSGARRRRNRSPTGFVADCAQRWPVPTRTTDTVPSRDRPRPPPSALFPHRQLSALRGFLLGRFPNAGRGHTNTKPHAAARIGRLSPKLPVMRPAAQSAFKVRTSPAQRYRPTTTLVLSRPGAIQLRTRWNRTSEPPNQSMRGPPNQFCAYRVLERGSRVGGLLVASPITKSLSLKNGRLRAEPVPPIAHGLLDDLDPSLLHQFLDIEVEEPEPDAERHRETGDRRTGLKVTEPAAPGHRGKVVLAGGRPQAGCF